MFLACAQNSSRWHALTLLSYCIIVSALFPACSKESVTISSGAATITGVEEGDYYKSPVTPDWTTPAGTESEPELLKDGVKLIGYSKGSSISADGVYRLTVYSWLSSGSNRVSSTVNFIIDASSPSMVLSTNVSLAGAELAIDFRKGSSFDTGNMPLYACWVEDVGGNFIQDLFVADAAATNVMRFTQTWETRPEALPYWAHKACIENPYANNPLHDTIGLYLALPTVDGGPIPADLDAVTGATQYVDFLLSSKRKGDGIRQFKVLFEINKSFDSNGYYNSAFSSDPYYDGSQPSLVYGTVIDLDSSKVDYTMKLLGSGHYAGRDGGLYSAGQHTTALNMVDRIVVSKK
jgi:hypothetical protein